MKFSVRVSSAKVPFLYRPIQKSIVMGNEIPTEPLHHVDTPFERITFGMGCFWGCDCLYGATRGVLRTRVGYSAGTTENPTYKNM